MKLLIDDDAYVLRALYRGIASLKLSSAPAISDCNNTWMRAKSEPSDTFFNLLSSRADTFSRLQLLYL